ncbi:hypothetical protein [Thiobaca trueperi]|uniref:Uncharacterized protein n=1 Tax=Thiobaca trueperi TaxID=127458 RepID=A0A4R3MWE2_9GAMM|nr:hypothetical protein [Thiobaca trueperi]TCT18224.1 hypothetical protein EDC35_11343 [Thiobaca trueperi]
MAEFFASGRVIDVILVMMLIEGLALTLYHRRTGKGIPPAGLAGFLLSGFVLLLTLRAALTGAWWGWICLGLTASLFTHLADLWLRWRNPGRKAQHQDIPSDPR